MSEGDQGVRQWREIAEAASREHDPERLKQLSEELAIALEERAKKLREQMIPLDEQAKKLREHRPPAPVPPADKKSA